MFIVLAVACVGLMSCESDSLETQSSIDKIVTLDEDGSETTIEIDRETGNVINSDSESISRSDYEDGDVINGTISKIVTHDIGNRRIECKKSQEECYTVGEGSGPCDPC